MKGYCKYSTTNEQMSLTFALTNEQLTSFIAQVSKNDPDTEKLLTDFFAKHQLPKKKRGRPAKNKSPGGDGGGVVVDVKEGNNDKNEPPKKKRGRPAKKKSPVADDVVPKDKSDAEEDVAPQEDVVPKKKKRGRPAKKKSPGAEEVVKEDISGDEDKNEQKDSPKKARVAREEVDSDFWGDLDDRDFLTYNYNDDKSSKFWQYCQYGNKVLICYGKCGKNGAIQQKTFENNEAVSKFLSKETASKEKKGYILV